MNKHILLCLVVVGLSIVPLRTIVEDPATHIADPSDGLLGAWDIWKVQNNLVAGKNIFSGDTFYPHAQSILFSDVFVTSAVLSLPFRLVIVEPLALYNVILLSSQILTVIAFYALLYLCMKSEGEMQDNEKIDWKRALLAGAIALLFSISSIHLHYVGHLHVFALQYVLMGLCCFVQWSRGGKGVWLIGFALFVALQVWQSFFLAYPMLFVACLSLCFSTMRVRVRLQWKWVLVSCLTLFVSVFPLAISYLHFFQTYHVVRDIREVIHFSMQLEDVWGKFFSPVLFLFCGLAFVLWLSRRFVIDTTQRLFGLAGCVFFVLCFGPALHWRGESVKLLVSNHVLHIPLPYTLLYYLVPGFQAFRTPSRFFPITMMCFLVLVGVVLHKRLNIRGAVLLFCCAVIVALTRPALATFPLPYVNEYPTTVSFLTTRPEHVVAVLPLSNWAQLSASDDIRWMLYTLQTDKTLLNGQSGFFPDEWMTYQHQVDIATMDRKMELLRARGVELVVIDTKWIHELPHESQSASKLFSDERFIVFTLRESKLLQ